MMCWWITYQKPNAMIINDKIKLTKYKRWAGTFNVHRSKPHNNFWRQVENTILICPFDFRGEQSTYVISFAKSRFYKCCEKYWFRKIQIFFHFVESRFFLFRKIQISQFRKIHISQNPVSPEVYVSVNFSCLHPPQADPFGSFWNSKIPTPGAKNLV